MAINNTLRSNVNKGQQIDNQEGYSKDNQTKWKKIRRKPGCVALEKINFSDYNKNFPQKAIKIHKWRKTITLFSTYQEKNRSQIEANVEKSML